MMKRVFSAFMCLMLLAACGGCGTASAKAEDLMEGITPNKPEANDDIADESAAALTDFAVRLFNECNKAGESTLVSPLSILYALGMTANGARGETLSQMEAAFGLSLPELNACLRLYADSLRDSAAKLSIANSLWLKEDENLSVEPSFLQANADHYGAGVYKAPFNEATPKAINGWVDENTDGTIKELLNELPEDVVMVIINALAFEAEWQSVYYEEDVEEGTFTTEDGAAQNASFMYSSEHSFIELENATGFIKPYEEGKYAFAALLPNEGESVAGLLSSLSGERLHAALANPESIKVNAVLPKFESGSSMELADILASMGIEDAFSRARADFSAMGSYGNERLFISRVVHKTFIAVDERGTKAGAATAVMAAPTSAEMPPAETKTVRLDRPFVYMLIDMEANLPVFIGTMMSID